jgi:hypothetical protein
VRTVVELIASLVDAGSTPEIVDRDGLDARLRESLGQLFVVVVEPADVGQDDDRLSGGARRPGVECPKGGPVGRVERQRSSLDRLAGERSDRRRAIEIEAHEKVPPE